MAKRKRAAGAWTFKVWIKIEAQEPTGKPYESSLSGAINGASVATFSDGGTALAYANTLQALGEHVGELSQFLEQVAAGNAEYDALQRRAVSLLGLMAGRVTDTSACATCAEIVKLLDGRSWSVDDLDEIARRLRVGGYTINDSESGRV